MSASKLKREPNGKSKRCKAVVPFSYIIEPLRPLAVPIDSLVPDEHNVRYHSKENLAAIKHSLHTFGQRLPIFVQKSTRKIIVGNGRWRVAKEMLKWTHIAAVIHDDTDVMTKTFAIADNRTSELGTWDEEAMLLLFQDDALKALIADLSLDTLQLSSGKWFADALAEYNVSDYFEEDATTHVPTNVAPATANNDVLFAYGVLARMKTEKRQRSLIAKLKSLGIQADAIKL